MSIKEKIPKRRFYNVRREDLLLKLNAMNEDVDELYNFMEELVDHYDRELKKRDDYIKQLIEIKRQ